ncbi:twin-arginine translocation signal domain-containing protein [Haladaptatus sp. DFWS20]|uniref:twin-arginine translocation signal domain-containing protein n=1 Tax=Haladaptatus sp. DFWS20 TaxID=3403467 RepID=UPI003EBB69A0
MRRRRFLTVSGAAFVGGTLAGCTGSGPEDGGDGNSTTKKANSSGQTTGKPDDENSGGATTDGGFALVSANVPNEAVLGEQFKLEFTIKNNGNSAGAFQSPIEVNGSEGGSDQSGTIQTEKIPAGETTTWSTKLSYPYVSTVTYKITAFEKSFSVKIVGPKLSTGETFLTPNEMAITIQDIVLTDHYRYQTGSGEMRDVEAGNGRQWAFVTVNAENKFRMRQSLPKGDTFSLVVGNRRQKPSNIAKSEGKYELERFGSRDVASGEGMSGWLAYEISADRSVSDLAVEWTGGDGSGSWSAQWSP